MTSPGVLQGTADQDLRTWTILSPVATSSNDDAIGPFRLERPIAGVRVGLLIDTAWDSYKPVLDEWEKLLTADGAHVDRLWLYGELVGGIQYDDPDEPRAIVDNWSEQIDCAVVGLGNCGGCTAQIVGNAVQLEDRSLPTVAVITTVFEEIANYLRDQLGHAELHLEVLPYPLEHQPEEYLRQVARDAYPQVLTKLGALHG
jgi:hypothetical protein